MAEAIPTKLITCWGVADSSFDEKSAKDANKWWKKIANFDIQDRSIQEKLNLTCSNTITVTRHETRPHHLYIFRQDGPWAEIRVELPDKPLLLFFLGKANKQDTTWHVTSKVFKHDTFYDSTKNHLCSQTEFTYDRFWKDSERFWFPTEEATTKQEVQMQQPPEILVPIRSSESTDDYSAFT